MRHNDESIVEMLFGRNEAALELIQNLYGRLISSIAYSVMKSDNVAEECLNDTLLEIWNTIPPKRPESLSAYACTIARRKAIDRLRGETAQKRYVPGNSEYQAVYEELAFLDDISDGVVERLEMKRVLSEFVGSLSGTNREIFMSRFYNFESLDSIASRLHMSKNTLGARLNRMRQRLAEKMRKEWSEQ